MDAVATEADLAYGQGKTRQPLWWGEGKPANPRDMSPRLSSSEVLAVHQVHQCDDNNSLPAQTGALL